MTRLLSLATAKKLFSYLLASYFLAWAAFYFVTTLVAIANFAWRQPMFDQWSMYEDLLGRPFPQNVLQLVNGHRPIIPNLIRVAEIKWFHTNQLLQISIGTACLLAMWCTLLAVVWKERTATACARAATTTLITLGLFWLANARMLMHGNESLHVYVLMLAMVWALLCTYEAHARQSLFYMFAASACCVVAMFCFGAGVATFPAVIVLGVFLRLPRRWTLVPVATLALCLSFYFALPGNDGVRGMIALRPLDGLLAVTRWQSSPWVVGWLGFADPPLYPWMNTAAPHQRVANVLRLTANFLTSMTRMGWRDLGACIGAAGLVGWAILCGRALMRRRQTSRVDSVVFGIGLFALAAACVFGLGRLNYLVQNPEQVFADRYLVWPSLFWMSTAVLWLRRTQRSRSSAVQGLAYVPCLLLPIALLPTQSANLTWAALVYRNAQSNAAALESGVYDESHFPGQSSAQEQTLREIALLRDKRAAMFADGAWRHIGEPWTGTLQASPDITVHAQWLTSVADPTADKPAGHLEGWATQGVRRLQKRGRLVVLTADNVVAGLAEWSFVSPAPRLPMFSIPHNRGFDGYVRDFDPHVKYLLTWLDFDTKEGFLLAELPAPPEQRR